MYVAQIRLRYRVFRMQVLEFRHRNLRLESSPVVTASAFEVSRHVSVVLRKLMMRGNEFCRASNLSSLVSVFRASGDRIVEVLDNGSIA
jgi:hypothetical protein